MLSCLRWADNTMRGGVGHGACKPSIETHKHYGGLGGLTNHDTNCAGKP